MDYNERVELQEQVETSGWKISLFTGEKDFKLSFQAFLLSLLNATYRDYFGILDRSNKKLPMPRKKIELSKTYKGYFLDGDYLEYERAVQYLSDSDIDPAYFLSIYYRYLQHKAKNNKGIMHFPTITYAMNNLDVFKKYSEYDRTYMPNFDQSDLHPIVAALSPAVRIIRQLWKNSDVSGNKLSSYLQQSQELFVNSAVTIAMQGTSDNKDDSLAPYYTWYNNILQELDKGDVDGDDIKNYFAQYCALLIYLPKTGYVHYSTLYSTVNEIQDTVCSIYGSLTSSRIEKLDDNEVKSLYVVWFGSAQYELLKKGTSRDLLYGKMRNSLMDSIKDFRQLSIIDYIRDFFSYYYKELDVSESDFNKVKCLMIHKGLCNEDSLGLLSIKGRV